MLDKVTGWSSGRSTRCTTSPRVGDGCIDQRTCYRRGRRGRRCRPHRCGSVLHGADARRMERARAHEDPRIHRRHDHPEIHAAHPLPRDGRGLRTDGTRARPGIISDDGRAIVRTLEAEHGDIRTAASGASTVTSTRPPTGSDPTPTSPSRLLRAAGNSESMTATCGSCTSTDSSRPQQCPQDGRSDLCRPRGRRARLVAPHTAATGKAGHPAGTTRLGLDEWEDVDAALAYGAARRRTRGSSWPDGHGSGHLLLIEERRTGT